MKSSHKKPSITSLVAFFLIVAPFVYVLSYAPVVKICRRSVETREVPRAQLSVSFQMRPVAVRRELADGSLYPLYSPVDSLIDRTSLRKPLFFWADIWGVREAFESGFQERCKPTMFEGGSLNPKVSTSTIPETLVL